MPRMNRKRIVLLLCVTAVLSLWAAMRWPCVIRSITGLPCPGCGLSRAWLAMLRLDLLSAFRYHPMFWSIPIFMLYFLFDGQLFRRKRWNIGIAAILIGGIVLCYAVRITGFHSGHTAI